MEVATYLKLPLPFLAHVSDLEHGGGQHCYDEGRGDHLYAVNRQPSERHVVSMTGEGKAPPVSSRREGVA